MPRTIEHRVHVLELCADEIWLIPQCPLDATLAALSNDE